MKRRYQNKLILQLYGVAVSALLAVLLFGCGDGSSTNDPYNNGYNNGYNPNNNPYYNNPYGNYYGNSGYGDYWGTQGYVNGNQFYLRDLYGNNIWQTNDFTNYGNYATYMGPAGSYLTVSLMGPTFPYYGANYFSNPWAYQNNFYYYPYLLNSYYNVGSYCYKNYETYSWGGSTYVAFYSQSGC